jgi:hypothetical protein
MTDEKAATNSLEGAQLGGKGLCCYPTAVIDYTGQGNHSRWAEWQWHLFAGRNTS